MTEREKPSVHFGGPDLPPRLLRNLLEERVRAVPAGGSIDWVTYYFRDRGLARALLDARDRGVRVGVVIDSRPRTRQASQEVVALLSGPNGLGESFRALALPVPFRHLGVKRRPHLHEKLYCFSHPEPIAFVGSFNPSGDDPEEHPELLAEIGDQDRGDNVLVGFRDAKLVRALVDHARWYLSDRRTFPVWARPAGGRSAAGADAEIHFLPQFGRHPVVRLLDRLGSGARLRVAASHLKGRAVSQGLLRLARRGATVEILAEATERRVPGAMEDRLRSAGIALRRCRAGLPMHNKFLLAEDGTSRSVAFGSFNWTTRSFWLNREICVISRDPELFRTFEERWEKAHRE
jgi:phosphatidylserine/phosphatidylglycerophosphate/cardiolipin synthase-like enzyme